MNIAIDGDGCPVVHETIALAKQYGVPCTIFCDTSHLIRDDYATTVTISTGRDAVDFALFQRVSRGDLVVTQDYGLAAIALGKGCIVINEDGKQYTDETIDYLLQQRHHHAQLRRSNKRVKGPKKRKKEQDEQFIHTLSTLLAEHAPSH